MSLDQIWKFVRYMLRQRLINAHEARELMRRAIDKRIRLNDSESIAMDSLFAEHSEETPF